MEYIISSRGRPIGFTALDFVRIDGCARSGWFHPNALGEQLMPTVALPYPAMCAFVCQDVRGEDGQPVVLPTVRSSTLFADLAEAFHRLEALELTLHQPDGTLIPTSMLGIQDTEEMRKLSDWGDLYPVAENPDEGEPWYEDLQRDLEELRSGWAESDDELGEDIDEPWLPTEEVAFPRYQVHLLLSEENAIP